MYKEGRGNNVCLTCPTPRSTSLQLGSPLLEMCVCPDSYFMMPNETLNTCEPCSGMHDIPWDATEDVFGTNCTYYGVNLYNIPTRQGFWRQSNVSRFVRRCLLEDNCPGGTTAGDEVCAIGQMGPMCGVCAPGYYGGKGGTKRCELCTGDPVLGVVLPVTFLVTLILGIIIVWNRGGKKIKAAMVKMVLAKQQVDAQEAKVIQGEYGGELEEFDEEEDEEDGEKGDGSKKAGLLSSTLWWNLMYKFARRSAKKLDDMGVKIKIIISLFQVMGEMSGTFSITYPDFVNDILSSMDAVEIELPALLPMACFFEAYMPIRLNAITNLIMRTALPLIVVFLLQLGSKSLRTAARLDRHALSRLRASGAIVTPEGLQREHDIKTNELVLLNIADGCSNLSFFIIFLVYPSCSSTVFNQFLCTTLDGHGEDGQRVMTMDNSIDCDSTIYRFSTVYALIMIVIYPLGTPFLYAVMLYIYRERLGKLRRDELRMDLEKKKTALRTLSFERHGVLSTGYLAPGARQERARREKAEAKEKKERGDEEEMSHEEKLEALQLNLPSTLRKLVNGYELRTYWWELFECARKISLIAVPIFLPPGSVDQLTVGILICFLSFSMYTAFAPFIEPSDDILSIVCQLQVFFALLSAILKRANPTSNVMNVVMPGERYTGFQPAIHLTHVLLALP